MSETNATHEPKKTPQATGRTAVLLYGYLRTYEETAFSFLKHVAQFLEADVFYFGPRETDRPDGNHDGVFDICGRIKENPKNKAEDRKEAVDQECIRQVYGDCLKAAVFHTTDAQLFRDFAAELSPDEWLFKLDPSRLFSMTYNMNGAFDVMRAYEEAHGFTYDTVVLTRPDLTFYAPLALDMRPGEIHIPSGIGFDLATGEKAEGNPHIFFYKNAATGEAVAAGPDFNDQLMVFGRKEADALGGLYEAMKQGAKERLPLSPETMLYFYFCVRGGMKCCRNRQWLYEIRRFGDPVIMNVTDIPHIHAVDPYNPKAVRRRRTGFGLTEYLLFFVRGVKHEIVAYVKNKIMIGMR